MKTLREYTELPIPNWAASYLVNGDSSGISESDAKQCDDYMQQFYDEAKEKGGHVIFSFGEESDSGFFQNPEFGLATDCTLSTVLIVK